MDVREKLRRGVPIGVEIDHEHWVKFKYESLPIFCYGCGLLGHDLESCTTTSEEQESKQKYSSALRAGSDALGPSPLLPSRVGVSRQKNYTQVVPDDNPGEEAAEKGLMDGDDIHVVPETQLGAVTAVATGPNIARVDDKGVNSTTLLDNPNPSNSEIHGMDVEEDLGSDHNSLAL